MIILKSPLILTLFKINFTPDISSINTQQWPMPMWHGAMLSNLTLNVFISNYQVDHMGPLVLPEYPSFASDYELLLVTPYKMANFEPNQSLSQKAMYYLALIYWFTLNGIHLKNIPSPYMYFF